METFQPGESVVLVDSAEHATGWIVAVKDDGRRIDVEWLRRRGYEHQVTTEPSEALRRWHESEDGML